MMKPRFEHKSILASRGVLLSLLYQVFLMHAVLFFFYLFLLFFLFLVFRIILLFQLAQEKFSYPLNVFSSSWLGSALKYRLTRLKSIQIYFVLSFM